MISWIQRTFQHHFRLIFAVLLIGMVIPFIFTIGSTPGIGRAERTAATRDFFGHNLLSDEERRGMLEDARMSAELQYGTSDVSAEQIQYYMYQRVASLHLADQLRLPPPTAAETTEFIKHLRIFLGQDGQFDVNRYDAFRNSLKSGSGVSEADIARVISDDARINKVGHLIAGPGFATPADVTEIMNKGDTTWTVSTATTDYASFAPGIVLTDAEIAKYFTDNSFRYTLPPRIGVDAVQFPSSEFTAGVAPTDAEVREYFDENPGKFPKPAAAAKVPAAKPDPAADYAAVQPQVRQALVAELAQRGAVKAASDLAYALYDGKVTRASLDSFLAARKLKAQSLAPFTREAGSAELGGSKDIAAAAFGLSADKFYSEGLPSPSGAVVLIWRESLPSREPALAEVRDKVRADAADNQRRIRFAEFGRTLKAGVVRRLKAGETFDKAVAESAGDAKVLVKSYPPFTLREQPKDVDPAVFQALDGLGKGSVSDMEATADKGVLVYAADKKLPAADPSNPRYAQVRAQIAAGFAAAAETSVTREFVDSELKRTDPGAK
jgi:peptidyl-prolyl cis-trans isomerase D